MSPASRATKRLRKLYGLVLRRIGCLERRWRQRLAAAPAVCRNGVRRLADGLALDGSDRRPQGLMEPLEPRLLLAAPAPAPGLDPVLLIPGFGGVFPAAGADLNAWLTQRGPATSTLQVDPLAHVYDDLIQTLQNVGYVQGQTLFVANWDWRVPVAPQDGTADGRLTNVTATSMTDSVYATGLDYLGYWLDQAVGAWEVSHPGQPLTQVDIITHSTGGLVARAYIQSAAYGQSYTHGTTTRTLPKVDDLVMCGAPNEGAGDVWNLLHDDFNASIASRGAGLIVHSAWDLAAEGTPIHAPDGTVMPFTNDPSFHQTFISQYIGAARDLLPTFPFLDSNLDGTYEALTGADANPLLADLNAISPATFVSSILGSLTVVYGASENTISGVQQHTGYAATLWPAVQHFDELLGHRPGLTETWYAEVDGAPGDGTVTRDSALWQFGTVAGVQLKEQVGISHRALVSDLKSQKTILTALGATGFTDGDITAEANGGDSGMMQLATKVFNEDAAFDALAGGIETFFGHLQDGVNSVFGGLPVIGSAFTDQAGSFFSDLGAGIAGVVELGPSGIVSAAQHGVYSLMHSVLQDINGDGQITPDDVAIGLVNGALEFRVELGGRIAGTSVDLDLDVGLPSLGLQLTVDGGVDLAVDWDLHLGFGVVLDGVSPRLYVVCDTGNEMDLKASVALAPGTTLTGRLGFLQLTATDIVDPDDIDNPTDPNDIPNPTGRTGLYGEVGIDLREPEYYMGTTGDGRLFNADLEALTVRRAVACIVNVGADVNLHLVTGFNGSAVFPSISADLDVDWDFLHIDTGFDKEAILQWGRPGIAFHNITLDLGSFLNDFVGPVLHKIDEVLDPIMPLVDALRAPVPVITQLGEYLGGLGLNYIDPLYDRNPGISILDMANAIRNIKPDPRLTFVLAVVDVIDIIHQVSSVSADGSIALGDLTLMTPFGSGQDVRAVNDLIGFNPAEFLMQNTSAQLDMPGGKGAKSFLKKAMSAAGQIIKFPILTDPMQAFKLLMGQDADLIYLDFPALDFKFQFGQGISIFPGLLTVDLGGTFEAYANIDVGFDTYGIRKFKQTGDVADIFDGFYLDDHVVNGVDQPEAYLKIGLNAGASVSAVLVAAEVSGGITGTLTADLVDIDPDGTFTKYKADGKIRPSEMAQLIAYSPMAFFDLKGSVDYYFHAWVGVGIIVDFGLFSIKETLYEKNWNLASGNLVKFELATPFPAQNPVLGEVVGGDLMLNMGPRAGYRRYGNTTDGGEDFTVSYQPADLTNADPSDDQPFFLVSAEGGVQSFPAAGITRIVADGGAGDDTILVDSTVPSTIKVLLHGGIGNDTLKAFGGDTHDGGGAGSAHAGLYGDDGNDLLQGGAGNDTLDGGAGDDRLLADGGNDELFGGPGSDYLRGDSGDDILHGDADDQGIYGGAGNDTIYVAGGSLNATRVPVDAGTGDDTIVAEYANLDIVGGHGHNALLLRDDGNAWVNPGVATLTLTRDPLRGDAGTLSVQRPGAAAELVTFADINVSLGVQLDGSQNALTVASALDAPLTITGGAGDDAIALQSTQAPTTVDLAGAGNDTLTVGRSGSLLFLDRTLTVKGGSEGGDQLILDTSADPANQVLSVDAPGSAAGYLTVAGLRLTSGVSVDYDAQVDAVEVDLGGGADQVTVPALTRAVIVRGGGGIDRADATLVNGTPVGSLTTYSVETVSLVDHRTGGAYGWELDGGALRCAGATVLAATGALTTSVQLGGASDIITVKHIEHATSLITGGGVDTVVLGGPAAGGTLDQVLAAPLTVDGGTEADTLTLDDTARLAAATGTLSAGSLTGFGLGASAAFAYAGFEAFSFLGGNAGYALTLAGTAGATTVTLGSGADNVTVTGTSDATTLRTGGGADQVTVVAAGPLLTVEGGADADRLYYQPPAGAAGNLVLQDGTGGYQGQIGFGASGVITDPDVRFKDIERLTLNLPDTSDALTLAQTFACSDGLYVNGNGGNDTITAATNAPAYIDGGAGSDTLRLDTRGKAPASFANVSFAPGLELLVIDNTSYGAAVHWTAASGLIQAGGQTIVDHTNAAETRILSDQSSSATLTIAQTAGGAVDLTASGDTTINGGRVVLISGAQVVNSLSFYNGNYAAGTSGTYTANNDILNGVADVATTGDDVYTASATGNTVEVFRRLTSGSLELHQVFQDGVAGLTTLAGANQILTDGAYVYVSAPGDSALTVFRRDGTTGLLTFVQAVIDGQTNVSGNLTVDGLTGVADILLAGSTLYAAGAGDNALALFTRLADGRLDFRQALRNGGNTNVALHKAASQSSTYNNLSYDGADRAVDGNTDPNWHGDNTNSITHTANDLNAWWQVNLGTYYNLDRIVLYDRAGFANWLSNFTLTVYNAGDYYTTVVWQQSVTRVSVNGGASLALHLPVGTSGNKIGIQFNGYNLDGNGYMNLAECQVFDRALTGMSGVKTITLSDSGDRLYTTNSSGIVDVFSRSTVTGDLTYLEDAQVSGVPTDAVEVNDAVLATQSGKRMLYVTTAGSSQVQAVDVTLDSPAARPAITNFDLSGLFNADVIYNYYNNAWDTTQNGAGTGGYYFLTQSAATKLGSKGPALPDNGLLTNPSLGFSVQLAYRNSDLGNNAIALPNIGSSVTLYLPTSSWGKYDKLYLFGGTPNYSIEDQYLSVVLTYTDMSTTTAVVTMPHAEDGADNPSHPLPAGAVPLIDNMDVAYGNPPTILGLNKNNKALFAVPVPADSTKTLARAAITVVRVNFQGGSPVWILGAVGAAPVASLDISSGFNNDMVTGSNGGTIDPPTSAEGWLPDNICYITQSAATQLGSTNGNGLPDNGLLPSPTVGSPLQLAYRNDQNGPNAILLTSSIPTAHISLPGASQGVYRNLYLIGASGYGDSVLAVTLRYADGSSETVQLNEDDIQDDGTAVSPGVLPLIDNMDWYQRNAWQNMNTVAVFAIPVPVDGTEILTGIDLTRVSGGQPCILGAAGQVAARPNVASDAGIGALSAIETAGDKRLWVLGPTSIEVLTADHRTGALTQGTTLPHGAGAPAGLVLVAAPYGLLAYVPDPSVRALRLVELAPPTVRPVEDWWCTMSGRDYWYIGGIAGGVKLTYEIVNPAASTPDNPTKFTFTTGHLWPITAPTYLTLDISLSAFQSWAGPAFQLRLLHNGVATILPVGAGAGTYKNEFYHNVVLELAAGDTYGIEVDLYADHPGAPGPVKGLKGNITLVQTTTGAATVAQGGPTNVTLGGLSAVALSPDGKFAYGVNPDVGALVALAVNPATGAMSPVQTLADHTYVTQAAVTGLAGASVLALSPSGNALYTLAPSTGRLAVLKRDPQSGLLTFLQDLAAPGATGLVAAADGTKVYTTSPSGLSVWTRQADGTLATPPVVYALADASDWVARAATTDLSPVPAANWSTTLTTITNRTSPAPVTSITDIPGGVKLSYSAVSGGWGHGTSTVQYDFATTATATTRVTLDLTFQGFHAWYQPELSLAIIRNGVVVTTLSGAAPDSQLYSFANQVVDVHAGDTYGIRLKAGNYDGLGGVFGEITVVTKAPALLATSDTLGAVRTLRDTGSGVSVLSTVTGLGHTSALALSPDAQTLAIADVAGTLQVLKRNASGAYVLQQTFREGTSGLRGLRGASGVVISGDFIYVAAKDSDDLVAFGWNAGTGQYELEQVLRNGNNPTLGLKAPNSLAVDPATGRLYVGSSAGVGLSTGGLASFTAATSASAVTHTQFAFSFSGIANLELTTGDGNDNVRVVSAIPGVLNTTINTGGADDLLQVVSFGNSMTISTGSGADTVDLRQGADATTLSVDTGAGADFVSLAGTAVGSTTTITTGADADTILVSGPALGAAVTVNAGGPAAVPGDTLLFDVGADYMASDNSDQSRAAGGSGAGAIWAVGASGPAGAAVNYTDIEVLTVIALSVADAGPDQTLAEGGALTLDATGSKVASASRTLAYSWDLNGDGTFGDRTGQQATLSWADLQASGMGDNGVYAVSVRVTDVSAPTGNPAWDALIGQYTDDSATITILNTPPALSLARVAAADVGQPYTVTFGAAGDPGADTVTGWAVAWGDGVTDRFAGSATQATHTYLTTGAYLVTATATDEDGSYAKTLPVQVNAPIPAIATVGATANLKISEGQGVTFQATAPGAPVFAWNIDGVDQGSDGDLFDDGVGAEVAFTWPQLVALGINDSGPHSVAVRATYTDFAGGTTHASAAATLTVDNVGPAASFTNSTAAPGSPILQGGAATVSFSGQQDPSPADQAAGWRYAYDFGNDGTFEIVGSANATVAVPAAYLCRAGQLTVRGVITDKDSGATEYVTAVAIRNAPPTVQLADVAGLLEGGMATLNGTIADPGASDTFTLTVDWGDGTTPTAVHPAAGPFRSTHRYDDTPMAHGADHFTVRATVEDDQGGTGVAQTSAAVTNVPPQLSALAVTPALAEGQAALLTGILSDPGAADTFVLTVDWGDGAVAQTVNLPAGTTAFNLAHPYQDNGAYGVTVAVADDAGATYQPVGSLPVVVSNVSAALAGVAVTPAVDEGGVATLSGQIVDPGAQDTFTLVVDWGDGSVAQTFHYSAGAPAFSETHRYTDNPAGAPAGQYPITLTLADDDAGTATAATAVAVHNVAPTLGAHFADGTATASIDANGAVTLAGTLSDPGLADSVAVTVTWGDGTSDPIGTWDLVGLRQEAEANGSLAQANDLTPCWVRASATELQVRITGEVAVGGDVDYYRVQALAGDGLRVDLTRFALSLAPGQVAADPAVVLLDGAGNPVASAANTGDGLDAVLQYTVPADGTYYLEVAATAPTIGGAYELAAGLTGPSASVPDDQRMGNRDYGDGRRSFAVTHQYHDAAGTLFRTYAIGVTAADGDGGTAGASLAATVGAVDVPAGTQRTLSALHIPAGVTLTKTGPGTLILDGAQAHGVGAVLNIQGGAVRLASDAGAGGANLAVVVNGGSLSIGSTQHLADLQLLGGGAAMIVGGNTVLLTNGLTIQAGASLDLADHALAVAYTSATRNQVLDAVAGGVRTAAAVPTDGSSTTPTWTGKGITSSNVQTEFFINGPAARTLGVYDNNYNGTDTPYFAGGTLDGVSLGADAATQANHVIVKYLYAGDLNGDGLVNGADYNVIDNAFVRQSRGESFVIDYQTGDLNSDGVLNGVDYNGIDNAELKWASPIYAWDGQGHPWSISGPPVPPISSPGAGDHPAASATPGGLGDSAPASGLSASQTSARTASGALLPALAAPAAPDAGGFAPAPAPAAEIGSLPAASPGVSPLLSSSSGPIPPAMSPPAPPPMVARRDRAPYPPLAGRSSPTPLALLGQPVAAPWWRRAPVAVDVLGAQGLPWTSEAQEGWSGATKPKPATWDWRRLELDLTAGAAGPARKMGE